jgi:hypothetical protein
MQAADQQQPGAMRRRGKTCGVENCLDAPTKGKPYCSEHLELVERADALIAEVRARETEIHAVLSAGPEGWRRVDVNGSVAKDILGVIEVYGPKPLRDIGRLAQLKAAIVVPYIQALRAANLVRVTYASAGRRTVSEVISLPA